jgi:hypothetical protein
MTSHMNVNPTTNEHGDTGLAALDEVLASWSADRKAFAKQGAEANEQRKRFVLEANQVFELIVRPAMEAAVDRLGQDGGGGRVQERPGDDRQNLRFTLWMSLEGEVANPPRQDRNPYLQLDLDAANEQVDVWEGDMWEKQGSSHVGKPWVLAEITTDSVTERIVAILRRSASHDVVGVSTAIRQP